MLEGSPQPCFPIEIHEAKYKQDDTHDRKHGNDHRDDSIIDLFCIRIETIVLPEKTKKKSKMYFYYFSKVCKIISINTSFCDFELEVLR